MNACPVPIVLFVFNRPEKLRRLLSILADVRPATLLVVADGPRVENAEDIVRCREVRELVAGVDWPCEIVRNYATRTLAATRGSRPASTGLSSRSKRRSCWRTTSSRSELLPVVRGHAVALPGCPVGAAGVRPQ